jgi:ribosome-associated protein
MSTIKPNVTIDEREIEEKFIRSSGPGGQNVNKVATAVQIRFDIRRSPSLPKAIRERLRHLGGNSVSTEGVLIIEARRFRTRERNRQDARKRLVSLISKAVKTPKSRRPTKPTPASRGRRLETKRCHGRLKKIRRDKSDIGD